MLVPCYDLPRLYYFEYGSDNYYAFVEKECGGIPEHKYWNISDRYWDHIGGYDLDAVMYISEEVFDPDNYNENSIKRESKIAF